MKRLITMVFALAALSCAAGNAAPVAGAKAPPAASKMSKLSIYAPADVYFGQLKISILGIRNQIHDIGAQYAVNHDIANAAFGKSVMTEVSLKDWERQYPLDPDIPRYVYLLSHLYDKFDLPDAKKRAHTTDLWLLAKYPKSWYAKDERRLIAYRAQHPVVAVATPAGVATLEPRPESLNAIAPLATPPASPKSSAAR